MRTEENSALGYSALKKGECPSTQSSFRSRDLQNQLHSNLYWSSSSGSESLALDYPSIAIHAVSRDTTAFPHECVYLQYLRHSKEEGEGEGEGEEEEEEEEEVEVMEVRLVPPSTEQCKYSLVNEDVHHTVYK